MLPNLPAWMQYFAFGVSASLAVLKITEMLRQPTLSVVLTREIFFRLSDSGEALFCNAILLARTGPVLVRSVRAVLKKTDQPEKSFPLDIEQFGEKIKGSGTYAEHFFHTTSPLAFIAASVPARTVYFCVQAGYRDRIREVLIESFQKRILDLKFALLEQQEVNDPELTRKVQMIVEEHSARIMELVQVESGHYELTLTVTFENPHPHRLLKPTTAGSRIAFTVKNDVRDVLRAQLKQNLFVSADNMLFDRTKAVIFPEYAPSNIAELSLKGQ